MKVERQAPAVVGANDNAELPAPEILPAETYRPEVQAAVSEAQEVLVDLRPFTVTTQEQAGVVEQVGRAAKLRWQAIEARRKAIVAPLNAAKDAVQALFNPALDDWAAVEREAKQKCAAWIMQQEAIRRAAEVAAEQAFTEGRPAGQVQALVAQSAAPVEQPKGSRKTWVAEVTDADALIRAALEGKAPRNLVGVIDAALQAYAKATKGSAELPGVRFVQRMDVQFR